MTTKKDERADLDVAGLRAAIDKTDQLIAHYQQGIGYATDLKRTLVLRLLRTQYDRLSIDEEAKLLKGYGVVLGEGSRPKT